MYEKWMRFLEVSWGVFFGVASVVCAVGAILTLVFSDGQGTDRFVLFAIYTLLLARGGD